MPIEIIGKYCRKCTDNVFECLNYSCSLYPYREGRYSPIDAIMGYCEACLLKTKHNKGCAHDKCVLFPHRKGFIGGPNQALTPEQNAILRRTREHLKRKKKEGNL